MLSTLDTLIIGTYFLFTLVLGIFLRRKAAQGIESYFLGGRTVPWWVLGASGTASNFDMTGTMIMVSFIFAIGLQGFWVAMRGGMCLPLGLLMVYMAKWLQRSNVMTTAEWMEFRFGSGVQGQAARLLSAVANLIVTLAFLTYFVEGTGKFLSVFLGWPPEICALVLIVIAVTYTTLSGLYGVVFTDLAQELLMIVAGIYVGIKAFLLPGQSEIITNASTSWDSFVPMWTAPPMTWLPSSGIYHFFGLTVVFWIARGLFEGAGGLTGGYMPQRYYAARNEREAGLMTVEWILLLLFRWALIIGIAILALWLSQTHTDIGNILNTDPEQALPIVIDRLIPAGLKGLVVAGLIAAAMSTFDSTVNAGAAYWVKDIYQRHLVPDAAPKQLLTQSYLASAALALGASLVGYFIPSIESIWGWITGPLSAGLFAPIILRWYWDRFNGFGFAASTGAGLIVAIGFRLALPDLPLFITFPTTWFLSLVTGIVVSLATPPTAPSVLEHFWKQIRPFGFWRRVRTTIEQAQVSIAAKENRRDIINIPFAIAWHLSGVVMVISLLLHKWDTLLYGGIVWLASAVWLYFRWYRRLGKKVVSHKNNNCFRDVECCKNSGLAQIETFRSIAQSGHHPGNLFN